MSNVAGKAYGMNVVTPMRPWLTWLNSALFMVSRAEPSLLQGLLNLSIIHFARWVMIKPDQWPDLGQGKQSLANDYMLFCSNFNGTWDQYIDAFSEVVPTRMKGIWGTSYGFPGPIPVEPFKQYIRKNEYVANHYWSAYPGATTTEIISAEHVAAAIDNLRRRADGLSPEQFKAAYDQMLTSVQGNL